MRGEIGALRRIFCVGLLGVGWLCGGERLVFSAVGDMRVRTEVLEGVGEGVELAGVDRAAFRVEVEGGRAEVGFSPVRGKGVYFAELRDGERTVGLAGLGTEKLEGKNEPGLQAIFEVLGVDLEAGGEGLHLDTGAEVIGDSVAAGEFEQVEGAGVFLTGVARYSPKGPTPFGLVAPDGELLEVGVMDAEPEEVPDAHQRLLPPICGGKRRVEVKEVPERFGLFLRARHYTSLTIPGASEGATIEYTARVYPVDEVLGVERENAFLVCFEEASNGDYQDAVFLLEGVRVAGGS